MTTETRRDVFEALLDAYCGELDYAATPEGEYPRDGDHTERRAEWLSRFDTAEGEGCGAREPVTTLNPNP